MRIHPNTIGFWAAATIGTTFGFCLAALPGIEGDAWISFAGTVLGGGLGAGFAVFGAWWVSHREIKEMRRGYARQLMYDLASVVNGFEPLIQSFRQGNLVAGHVQTLLVPPIRQARQGPGAMIPSVQVPLFLAEQALLRTQQAQAHDAAGLLVEARDRLLQTFEILNHHT